MGILRADRVSGLGGANAINGSVKFASDAGAAQGTYLEVSDPDGDIKFGTSDWTIEFWMYANTIDTSEQENDFASILDFGYGIGSGNSTTGAWFAVHQEDATLHLAFNNNNQVQSSNFLTANTWHHIAITRTSNTAKIYGDGTQVATVSCSQNFTDATWRFLDIGSQPGSTTERNFDGYISNLRIIKGTALYTAAFTPPTGRLEKTSDTVLLCCQSPGNAYKEETGKIIVVGTASKTPGPTASHFAPDVGEDHGTAFTDNTKFDTLSYMVPPGGTSAESNRGRGLIGNVGGEFSNGIHYVQIQTSGVSVNFGDLSNDKRRESVVCSSTRGLFAGGDAPSGGSEINAIEYVTIATTGQNGLDFGDLTAASGMGSGCSSQTRGVIALGYDHPTAVNSIDYVTIATTGNAADFGDSTDARNNSSSLSSPTRGIWAGGTPSYKDTIDYVTIASAGNATDFGNLATAAFATSAASSSTRGIFAGGGISASPNQFANNSIQYITIASTGNASDFGDLSVARGNASGLSNSTTAVFAGGCTDNGGSTATNTMDYVTIATTGNAADFGDTSATCLRTQGSSDSHGGIS